MDKLDWLVYGMLALWTFGVPILFWIGGPWNLSCSKSETE